MSDKKEKKVVYKTTILPRFDGKEIPIRTLNAYAFGTVGKKLYFCSMHKETNERGREIYVKEMHTIKDGNNKEIEVVPKEKVDEEFNKVKFY